MVVNIGFSRKEAALMAALEAETEMEPEALVRAALRLYQTVHERAKRGERIAWVGADGRLLNEEVGCTGEDP